MEEEITDEAEGTSDRRRSFGCPGRRDLVVEQGRRPKKAAKGTDTGTKMLTIPDDQFQEIQIKKLTGEAENLVARKRKMADYGAQAAAGRSGRGRRRW